MAEILTDTAFLAECARFGLGINALRSGEELQDVIARAYYTPQPIIQRRRWSYDPRSPAGQPPITDGSAAFRSSRNSRGL